MKKMATVLALILMTTMVWLPAWARGPRSGQAAAAASVTPEQRDQFLKETESIRKSIWEKQIQLNDLLGKPESDPAKIGALEKEIYGLREQMREKAVAAGMPCPMAGPGMGRGYGMGAGRAGCWRASW